MSADEYGISGGALQTLAVPPGWSWRAGSTLRKPGTSIVRFTSTSACPGSVLTCVTGIWIGSSTLLSPLVSQCLIRGPEALRRIVLIERRVVDGSKMASRAHLRVDLSALADALVCRSSMRCRRKLRWPFRRLEPTELPRSASVSGPATEPSSIHSRSCMCDGGAPDLVRRIGVRQVEQRRDAERLAGIADQRLLDRGVILRELEPRHGPDRREADGRVLRVQVLLESA